MNTNTDTVVITVTRKQAQLIEDAIQFSAVSIIKGQDKFNADAPDYRRNREVFGIVWDAIYSETKGL